jgi:hypothetical protein
MAMTYLRVAWLHDHADEPVEMYSELDDERWETRSVDVFRDGRLGFANAEVEFGGTGLGETPIPPIEEIAADPQFVPTVITAAEFEAIWERATRAS